ncbi:hypothetical protein ACFOWB_22065 [Chenggangzhangella methanolivorans]|uniref:hypothetical protein n=1 Tax=Chenggangzhangella methanolivorans TaxID=1437009 RepID=UPI00360D744C
MTPQLNFVIDQPDHAMPRFLAIRSVADCFARDPGVAAGIASQGDLCWSLQTYLNLAQWTYLPVSCSNRLRDDAINFVHSDQLGKIGGRSSAFVVCLRADYPARRWAHHHIVQNKLQASATATYLPLWAQPGLIKRSGGRKSVETAAYVGQTFNGNLAADAVFWRKAFASIDLEFLTPPREAWHDFSGVDILVGVRSFDRRRYPTKPPSKLINAWRAEVPFIGGFDSAYEQVGRPGQDFLQARTVEGVMQAAFVLKHDRSAYERLVETGRAAAEAFSEESLCSRWTSVIRKVIEPRYERWLAGARYETPRFHAMFALGRVEKRTRAFARGAIDLARFAVRA